MASPSSRVPTLREAFSLLAGRPARWLPQLCALIFVLWYFGPAIRGLPPVDLFNAPLPPPIGHPHRPPLYRPPTASADEWKLRAHQVREAFIHSYKGYKEHAFPADELAPMSGKKVDNFNGWQISMYDGLDSMWILGLTDYFDEAVKVIEQANYTTKPKQYVPFFETVIRQLGGLLSAYALSGEPVLLQKADELGGMLLPAFDTESGFPMYAISTRTNATRSSWAGSASLFAEVLSNQLEYKYLAHLTGKSEYYEKAERCMELMYQANITDGLFPTRWNTRLGTPSNNQFSVGAFADSAHEYLLKQWLMTSRSETKIKDLYLRASKSIIEHLLYVTPDRDILYVTDAEIREVHQTTAGITDLPISATSASLPTISSYPSGNFEHLSCFLPGLLALGAQTLDLPPSEKEMHSFAAEGLAYSCWLTYADMKSGLGPDMMAMRLFQPNVTDGLWLPKVQKWKEQGRRGRPPGLREPGPASRKRDYTIYKRTYLLRPEALESFYILWRTTGNPVWRERGWSVFQSIQKHAKTELGYASIMDVDSSSDKIPVKDEMPSYFFAETLKYLYLLFTDEEIIPLDRFVFNTEAHPLPIFEWTEEEKKLYNIS
ncbi:glycoside hydrolase family 47 protein [Collybiopsis luxurians FD-317 M1]|uniref:alpha-1,2-Mannosidase n=1 Tax=Collybiopsis luxurians FD-317 M1 TaxID=944289 RepID=A0A0D0CYY3_9AGAR|nr:glycoside hydrolase family 47 protein [Collybiopsis luxurians FD-317 M1]